MTTYFPFTPTPQQAVTFQATLDDAPYQIVVPWNAYGKRWYVQCIDTTNVLVFNLPLIGSPDNGDINLLAGYFIASTMVFRVSTQTFEINP